MEKGGARGEARRGKQQTQTRGRTRGGRLTLPSSSDDEDLASTESLDGPKAGDSTDDIHRSQDDLGHVGVG